VLRRTDPWGRPYYWLDEGRVEWATRQETDYEAVKAGLISVTPLHADLTAHAAMERTAAIVDRVRPRAQAR
jgi:5'-nucleotidase